VNHAQSVDLVILGFLEDHNANDLLPPVKNMISPDAIIDHCEYRLFPLVSL